MQNFKQAEFTMAATAKASMAASSVAANAKYDQGVAVFTLPQSGAMVKAAIGGRSSSSHQSGRHPARAAEQANRRTRRAEFNGELDYPFPSVR